MTFVRPDLAATLFALPLVIAGWLLHRHGRASFRRRASVAPRFGGLSRRTGPARDRAVLVTGLLGAASLSLALMRPQITVTRQVPELEHEDLIVMLDRSASMLARDILPSRAARATLELRTLLNARPSGVDRVALIGFADVPVVLSYPTADTDALLFYFDWLDADPAILFGTNTGAALNVALDVAAKDDVRARKVFLLVSDGDDQGTELTGVLAAVRARGYRVHCIGVGSDRTVPIVLPQPGGHSSAMLDDEGHAVTTRFSEGTLRRIASATGGQYVRSTTGAELQRGLASILAGEQRVVGWRTETAPRELHAVFLAAAVLAGALLWVLA